MHIHIDIYINLDFIIRNSDIQGNRKMEEKAKERDNKLLLTLIGWSKVEYSFNVILFHFRCGKSLLIVKKWLHSL